MSSWQRSQGQAVDETNDQSDSALVVGAKRDPAAFAILYERYRDDVLRYCFHCLGNWEDAADAAQQTFTNAFAGLPNFQDRNNSFKGWLLRIAHNEVCSRHRQQKRRREQTLAEANWLVDPARSPEDQAVISDDHNRLLLLMLSLSKDQQRVCALRFAGMPDRETAQILGKSEAAVRTAFSRGLAEIRDRMGVQLERNRGGHG